MKILLISPYKTSSENKREYSLEPLGLLSLATYIKSEASNEIQIKILDAQIEGKEHCIKTKRGYRSGLEDFEIENVLKEFKPNVVGISNSYTSHTKDVLEITKLVKKTHDCILIIGGAHATIAHKEIIKLKEIDLVVRGEGEETFKEVISALNKKSSLDKVKGITFKKNNQIKVNPDRPALDINTLPIPDRSLINYKKYLERTSETYFYTLNKPVGTIFTSRGCPFRCIFCSTQKVWTNKWRGRNAENVIKEIEYLHNKFGVKEISFMDDQFMGSKKRIIEICNLLIEKKLDISLIVPAGISPSLIDFSTLKLMKKAGFYRICFSIDVGTNTSRNFVRKPLNLQNMGALVKRANSLGMWTYATFVIGFPEEKKEDILATIRYAYNLKLDFVRFYIVQPHLGSDLYDLYLKQGIINKNIIEDHHTLYEAIFGTKYLSAKELEELRNQAEAGYIKFHIKHFFNPLYLFYEFLQKLYPPKKLFYFLGLLKNYGSAIR